jgi:restriction endonuclease S subunit
VGSIKDSVVALPPLEEQEAIATFIQNLTAKIDRLKSEVNSAIKLLTEYRSSLITQAVTGKIDVRDEVSDQELSYAAEEGESYITN